MSSFPARQFLLGAGLGLLLGGFFLYIHALTARPPVSPSVSAEPSWPQGRPAPALAAASAASDETKSPALTREPAPALAAREPLAAEQERPWLARMRPRPRPREDIPKDYGPAARRFVASARRHEGRFRELAVRYTRKHPAVARFGVEWMRQPDLRRLNNEWAQRRDPIHFAFGAADSENFHKLLARYGARPEFQAFLVEALRAAPGELSDAFGEYLGSDAGARALAERFSRTAGLPPGSWKPSSKPGGK